MSVDPRFLADVMLGSLARWLRILGYDTEYDNRIHDDQLVERGLAEGRIVLTRDTRLMERSALRDGHLLVRGQTLEEQILEVLRFVEARVDEARLLTRCLECNRLLTPVDRESVGCEVPPYVYRTQDRFKRCPGCRRLYWPGTHRDRILESLMNLRA